MTARTWSVLWSLALCGCVSIGTGGEPAAHVQYALRDVPGQDIERRAQPLVDALLVEPGAASALADSLAIAYSTREGEYAFYQLASWTERPMRQIPRLLLHRLEQRGTAGATGLMGDPLRTDRLLVIGIDTLHHDLQSSPGLARFALTADLFDRRTRTRVAHRRFDAVEPTARADSSAAAQAFSRALGRTFDELVPWLESELQRSPSNRP
jgi:ABC-type uncharacterized transport system auxiliary subunit